MNGKTGLFLPFTLAFLLSLCEWSQDGLIGAGVGALEVKKASSILRKREVDDSKRGGGRMFGAEMKRGGGRGFEGALMGEDAKRAASSLHKLDLLDKRGGARIFGDPLLKKSGGRAFAGMEDLEKRAGGRSFYSPSSLYDVEDLLKRGGGRLFNYFYKRGGGRSFGEVEKRGGGRPFFMYKRPQADDSLLSIAKRPGARSFWSFGPVRRNHWYDSFRMKRPMGRYFVW